MPSLGCCQHKAYNLQGDFKENEINLIRNDLLSDLVYQENKNGWSYYQELDYNFGVEVAYKNGVTDNVGRTTAQGISYILNKEINFNSVRASTMYFFKGKVTDTGRGSLVTYKWELEFLKSIFVFLLSLKKLRINSVCTQIFFLLPKYSQ